jgi:hypothetical protein
VSTLDELLALITEKTTESVAVSMVATLAAKTPQDRRHEAADRAWALLRHALLP